MLPPEVHTMLPSHIKIHWHICLELVNTVFACKQGLICAYFSPELDKITFLSNIMDEGLVF